MTYRVRVRNANSSLRELLRERKDGVHDEVLFFFRHLVKQRQDNCVIRGQVGLGQTRVPKRVSEWLLSVNRHNATASGDAYFKQLLHKVIALNGRIRGETNDVGLEVVPIALRLLRRPHPGNLAQAFGIAIGKEATALKKAG